MKMLNAALSAKWRYQNAIYASGMDFLRDSRSRKTLFLSRLGKRCRYFFRFVYSRKRSLLSSTSSRVASCKCAGTLSDPRYSLIYRRRELPVEHTLHLHLPYAMVAQIEILALVQELKGVGVIDRRLRRVGSHRL